MSVVTNKVRGREGWKAIVEDADSGAQHDAAAASRSEGREHASREMPIVEQVLIVVTSTQRHRQVGSQLDFVLHVAAHDLLE